MEQKMEQLDGRVQDLGESYFDLDFNVQLLEQDLKVLNSRASDMDDEVAMLTNRVQELAAGRYSLKGDREVEMQERGEPLVVRRVFGIEFNQNMEKIWSCLVNDNVSTIGICGMGGVGKTTLAKHVHNRLLERTNFRVCWITVSQEFSIRRLQKQIAKNVQLELSDVDDDEERAGTLFKKLKKMDNCVLIFDDVWKDFSLEEVGVPVDAEQCRLILTTRSLEVCRRMCCQIVFEAKTLDVDEAWELFRYKLCDQTLLPADVKEIAKSVAKRCSGLPLGIIAVAGSMRGVMDIREWRNTLEQLNALSFGHEDMEQKVFPLLESSFGRLNKCYQNCLLYCCLYPEDTDIERRELIWRFISAGLMDKRKTREQDFDQGHAILNKLVNVCLLEKTTDLWDRECVKMHDLIRDMALRITRGRSSNLMISEGMPKFMVKAGVGLKEIPDEKEWAEDLCIVSLLGNGELSEISPNTTPRCPNLSTLILCETSLRSIPNSFFAHMTNLKVLDLSYSCIEELPNCVSDMEKLTTLLMHHCTLLAYVPALGKLKELRELDLSGTSIRKVPQGLETLTNLKYLNMFRTGTWLEGSQILALKQLEDFYGGLSGVRAYNKLITTAYQIHGPPDSYFIVVGEGRGHDKVVVFGDVDILGRTHRNLIFDGCRFGNNMVLLLPQNVEELQLLSCRGTGSCLSDVIPQLNSPKNLLDLKLCELDELELVLRLSSLDEQQEEGSSCAPLPCLKTLRLYNLANLIGLVGTGRLPLATFSQLQILDIGWCGKIRTILTLALLQNLQNLQGLSVAWCDELEEIVEVRTNTPEVVLPKLEDLTLLLLPKLTSSSYNRTMLCVPQLKRLEISRSYKLKTIFTLPLLQKLQNLEVLDVGGCEILEEIISTVVDNQREGLESGISISSCRTSDVVLPKLEVLTLWDLPELKSIITGTMVCHSIKRIWVRDCPKLKRLSLSLSTIQRLEFMKGSEEWLESLEWDHPSAQNALHAKLR